MKIHEQIEQPLDERFRFWLPPAAETSLQGIDGKDLSVPQIPLPVFKETDCSPLPAKQDLGEGLYAYLRQFPDCPLNRDYAELLQRGFPHYLSDLAAQALLLEHKTVDAPYLQRQLNCLKILALLNPDRADLQLQLGVASYRLALMFQELAHCQKYLLSALGHFNQALKNQPGDAAVLNYLAHVNFLIGDYPIALRRWQEALTCVEDAALAEALKLRIRQLEEWDVPDYPLQDDLEQLGLALQAHNQEEFSEALQLLEGIMERGFLLKEFSFPEIYYLAGLCQVQLKKTSSATTNFNLALKLDPEFTPAIEALAQVSGRRDS